MVGESEVMATDRSSLGQVGLWPLQEAVVLPRWDSLLRNKVMGKASLSFTFKESWSNLPDFPKGQRDFRARVHLKKLNSVCDFT